MRTPEVAMFLPSQIFHWIMPSIHVTETSVTVVAELEIHGEIQLLFKDVVTLTMGRNFAYIIWILKKIVLERQNSLN